MLELTSDAGQEGVSMHASDQGLTKDPFGCLVDNTMFHELIVGFEGRIDFDILEKERLICTIS